jgi:Protein of unknown function, DUF488
MTTLYTVSYRAWTPGLGQLVVTSLGLPKWLLPEARTWPRCWPLTPRSSYFDAPDDEFERAYVAQLERHGPRRIAQELAAIARETGAETLLLACFEPRREECHRSLAASWWMARTGERIPEITP